MLQSIDQQCHHYPVKQLCQVLRVVFSCYYARRLALRSGAVEKPALAWETKTGTVLDYFARRYVMRRLQVELQSRAAQVLRSAHH